MLILYYCLYMKNYNSICEYMLVDLTVGYHVIGCVAYMICSLDCYQDGAQPWHIGWPICSLLLNAHTFSAFWLWSSVVSVLISVTADMSPTGDLHVTTIFLGEELVLGLPRPSWVLPWHGTLPGAAHPLGESMLQDTLTVMSLFAMFRLRHKHVHIHAHAC